MKLLKEWEYKKAFEQTQPYCITAPFGLSWKWTPKTKTLIITSKNYLHHFQHPNYEIRTLEKNHAKLAIGDNNLLVGSWNWSLAHPTATRNNEILIYIEKQNLLYTQLQDWFEEHWKKAHKVEQ